jgi:hypothetical protein
MDWKLQALGENGDTFRMKVPGGWILMDGGPDSKAMVYIPQPKP